MTVRTFIRTDGPDDGDPLVLLHGVGLDHTMYDLVVDELARSGRRVVRYDLLGHGKTNDSKGQRTLDDFVAQLLEVLDAEHLAAPHIAGLSIGGLITKALAMRHPERCGRLALLNTVFGRTNAQIAANQTRLEAAENDGLAVIADLAINRWFSSEWQQRHPTLVATVRDRIVSTDVDAYLKAYRVFIGGDPLDAVATNSIASPTLVMTGELDRGSTVEMSFRLAAAVPNGQALVLPGLHHVPPIENPSAFSTALINFLDQEFS